MRRIRSTVALTVLVVFGVDVGFVGSASADSTSFDLVCQTASGTQTFTLVKPNQNSAIFTDGTALLVSAIGASVTGGAAQQQAVPCTVNGEGPFPFLIVRA
jgi:hypothetical protein